MLRNILFIIGAGLLSYFSFSTFISTSELVGSFGADFSGINHRLFGYLSYIYPLALMVSLFLWFKNPGFSFRRVEIILSSVLLFFTLTIFQGLVNSGVLRGSLGGNFVDFLSPYIGLAGVWIFWSMSSSLAVMILLDKSFSEVFQWIKSLELERFLPKMPKMKPSVIKEEKPEKKKKLVKVIQEEQEVSLPMLEEDEVFIPEPPSLYAEEKTEESKPEVLEKEEPTTKTIVSKAKEIKVIKKTEIAAKEEKHAVIVNELEENKQLLDQIEKGTVEKPKDFQLPSVEFLQKPQKIDNTINEEELDAKIQDLIEKLAHFKIDGDVVRTYAGPVVSTFEFKPVANVKVSKILNLQDDLAMALKAQTIRIQAPIPGKDVVGIEIPNKNVETIYLREIFESDLFKESSSPLTLVLGKDIVGKPFITDLKKLPHLLIAGTTGSGKSVGINSMILSLLYKNSPDNLKLLMIDPKMLEFSIYNDIPHLLTPVITKAKQAIVALNNMVAEMERRYGLMAETRTKSIDNYNEKAKKEGKETFPYIVVIIDELADLMMTSGKDVEFSIARLAQMARASGIHLIVATQRPSVDVVTGMIKANLPSRISYKVGQKIDSKIILDQMGAESLLGRGDMLFTPPGMSGVVRLHAPWSSEDEIEEIVEFLKSQRMAEYDKRFLLEEGGLKSDAPKNDIEEEQDELYLQARGIVLTDKKTSISYLQRRLQIGYNRSARIIEQLENNGVLSAPNSKGNREILTLV
ncbi:DNA translocase FtsK [Sulfurimonas sp. MAG313]|nr:DNA translocase FtsK [Sulfurimonas sp. MAG313]MDF1881239.1 DNA translocase FtsK [Sulfurimonas sp. MAG313]